MVSNYNHHFGKLSTSNIERGDIMEDKCRPLIDILSEIPDLRKSKGSSVSHFLSAVGHAMGLTLAQSGVDSKTKEEAGPSRLLELVRGTMPKGC